MNMQINFSQGVNIRNMQIGDNNTMKAQDIALPKTLGESDWNELKSFLERQLQENKEADIDKLMVQKTLHYVDDRDENGLKGFIKRNREGFFTNVLSDMASSGLTLLLKSLIL